MKEKKTVWKICAKKADFFKLAEKFDIDPVIARLIRNRDVENEEDFEKFLKADLKYIHSPILLKDMEKSANIIRWHIENKKHIRIVGDYDTDGTCATYILLKGLNYLGGISDYYIPDRIKDGYGINKDIVKQAHKDNVDLIITCDNGIAAIEELEMANKLNIDVIVTDHHQLVYRQINKSKEYIMPKAASIINPHRYDCNYPFKDICGAFIAFKLIEYMFDFLGFKVAKDKEIIEQLRFFAAIATVGDLMPLKDENRILVKYCLSNFKKCNNIGLNALVEKLKLNKNNIKAYDIGFRISPCINAGGRLSTAKMVLNLFNAKNVKEASFLAEELFLINEKRKEITQVETKKAEKIIENYNEDEKVIVLYLPTCHESIVGIVASRIKDKYHRPTLIITDSNDELKGSARSICSYDMYEELSKCRDIFNHFGGHKMAAGFSLPKYKLEELKIRLNQNTTLIYDDLTQIVLLDLKMPLYYINKKLINELSLMEPFGMGNTKPIFGAKDIEIISIRQIGKNKEYLKLLLKTEKGAKIDALVFEMADKLKYSIIQKYGIESFENLLRGINTKNITISITYYPLLNTYMDMETIQINISDFKL